MAHTKGPWKLQHEFDNEPAFIMANGDQDIAEVCPFENGVGLSNALLITAAPDLLEALKLFVSIYPDKVRNHPDVKIAIFHAEKAIAKAEGRE